MLTVTPTPTSSRHGRRLSDARAPPTGAPAPHLVSQHSSSSTSTLLAAPPARMSRHTRHASESVLPTAHAFPSGARQPSPHRTSSRQPSPHRSPSRTRQRSHSRGPAMPGSAPHMPVALPPSPSMPTQPIRLRRGSDARLPTAVFAGTAGTAMAPGTHGLHARRGSDHRLPPMFSAGTPASMLAPPVDQRRQRTVSESRAHDAARPATLPVNPRPLPIADHARPVPTRKRTLSLSSLRVHVKEYGAAQHQGGRPYQEDAYTIVPAAKYASGVPSGAQAMFGVYDGHGGHAASGHAARHLHEHLLSASSFQRGQFDQALADAFAREDADLLAYMTRKAVRGGSTAVVVVLDLAHACLYSANVGDSRAVLARAEETRAGGTYFRAVRLSKDQNPHEPSERARIEALGGRITADGRVGTLAVSRALGDFTYKLTPANAAHPHPELVAAMRAGAACPPPASLVSGAPHISSTGVHAPSTPFLLLGSDGMFAARTDQELVDAVTHLRWRKHWDAQAIAQRLVDEAAAAGHGAADNCTCIVVFFE